METFLICGIVAVVFYYLGRKDEQKEVIRLKEFYQATIRELQAEIISQKEINK